MAGAGRVGGMSEATDQVRAAIEAAEHDIAAPISYLASLGETYAAEHAGDDPDGAATAAVRAAAAREKIEVFRSALADMTALEVLAEAAGG